MITDSVRASSVNESDLDDSDDHQSLLKNTSFNQICKIARKRALPILFDNHAIKFLK